METPVIFSHLKIKAGDRTNLKGILAPDAKSVIINIGRDETNLILHLAFLFVRPPGVETRSIVLNSMENGEWGEAEKFQALSLPYLKGEEASMTIIFNAQKVKVNMQGVQYLTFPNRLGLESAEFLSIQGDFRITTLTFHGA